MRGARSAGIASLLAAALALAGCGTREDGRPAAGPAGPGSTLSAGGLYRISLEPESGAIPLNVMHSWVVGVETAGGEVVEPTRIAFDGGMPQHGHGFVTVPRVTRSLGGGRYRIEGVKFHMGGEWTLRVEVVGPAGPDAAVFLVQVDG